MDALYVAQSVMSQILFATFCDTQVSITLTVDAADPPVGNCPCSREPDSRMLPILAAVKKAADSMGVAAGYAERLSVWIKLNRLTGRSTKGVTLLPDGLAPTIPKA